MRLLCVQHCHKQKALKSGLLRLALKQSIEATEQRLDSLRNALWTPILQVCMAFSKDKGPGLA